MQTNGEVRAPGAALTRSKAGLDRCRHAAEKAAGKPVVIPQDEGKGPYETAQAHGRDITIPILSRNKGATAPPALSQALAKYAPQKQMAGQARP